MAIRDHRVTAFCNWLDTVPPPPAPAFHTLPEFRFYADLTDEEMNAAQALLRSRGKAAQAEADKLRDELARRRNEPFGRIEPVKTTVEQDAAVENITRDAVTATGDVCAAAELLMGAAAALLIRSYSLDAASNLFEMMVQGGREAFAEARK